ncbi:MAG: AAA family ATPase, partial [Betaproteobacteria bacterium]|nr:AAA family ATPase [Betaproteobacteria bacterium]
MTPQRVCLLGAESTGKTTLAAQLARALPGLWVPEYLRDFCRLQGRVPRPDEQVHVAQEQMRHESLALAAAQRAGLPAVVCDTAPLMTAIYSR